MASVVASIVIASIAMAFVVIAYMAMASIVVGYIVVVDIVMAYIVMALVYRKDLFSVVVPKSVLAVQDVPAIDRGAVVLQRDPRVLLTYVVMANKGYDLQ